MKSSASIFPGLRLVRRLALMGAVLGATALAGCYVVPVNQAYPSAPASTVQIAPPPSSVTFTARLYPANDAASAYGMVSAVVTNDLHGRGIFTTNINGESFSGEATRVAGSSSREGIANGAGSRGSYINCRYQMNSATLGTGQCKLSNGANFTMHVGS
ncbi:hypothetical protein [Polaromonas hydrogenivorans]|uniref:Lipoprotein n=1 Tax=Polaromonas hydrogenivorans TaxID=335476 RepID=A0AAU7LS86_9BURK